jgi:hypothetical protein
MTFEGYAKDLREADEKLLEANIAVHRQDLTACEEIMSNCRETGQAIPETLLRTINDTRIGLRLAERELARRSQEPWGVCDNGIDDSDNGNST